MGVFGVGLGEGEVAVDHFQRSVAEEGLEGKYVAAVAKEVDGKCMAKPMGVGAGGDAGAVAEAADDEVEAAAGHGLVCFPDDDEGRVARLGSGASGEVAPYCFGGATADA